MNKFIAIFIVIGNLFSHSVLASEKEPPFNDALEREHSVLVLPPQSFEIAAPKISYHAKTQTVRFIAAKPGTSILQPDGLSSSASPEIAARHFLTIYGSLFGLTNQAKELELMRDKITFQSRSIERFQQIYQNIPIVGGEIIVQMDAANNIISINGEISPNLKSLNITPTISATQAIKTALATIAKQHQIDSNQLSASLPELWIYDPALLDAPGPQIKSLVWRMEVNIIENGHIRELALVDAHTDIVVLHFNQIHAALDRKIYNNQDDSNKTLPGDLTRSEGDSATSITDVDQAYEFTGDTYDFYWNEHGRDGIDDNGMAIVSTVRYCSTASPCPLENAYWNGTQMLFGDGWTSADDIVAHELTHGVTKYESALFYHYQSGAINESLSDIWGEFVDQVNGVGSDTVADKWQIGEDLPDGTLRNMDDPTLDNQPDKMSSSYYSCSAADNGGVHTNNGVNNKAVYLMTDGGTFNGKTITGLGISKVADLYYEVQTNLLTSGANYADLYDALLQAGSNLGYSSSECTQVKNALDATEMNQQLVCSTPPVSICPNDEKPNDLFFDDLESGDSNWTINTTIAGNPDPNWFVPQTTSTIEGFTSPYAASGVGNIWGYNQASKSDTNVSMNLDVSIPANAFMHFNHAYAFNSYFDGGVLEYSTNTGTTWNDADSLIIDNGYNGTIDSTFDDNPLENRVAFVEESQGYIASRLDLSSLSGQDVRFRFRIGTDDGGKNKGWFIDTIRIYTCVEAIAPTVTTFTPTNNATDIAIDTNLTLTFSENVVVKTGNIVILTASDNSLVESIDVASTQVTGSGTDTITIAPTADFSSNTQYYVLIDNTAFEDAMGNAYLGITNSTDWQLTTTSLPTNLTLNVSQTSFSENAGTSASTGTITRSGSTANDLIVNLSSSDTSEVNVPATVTITQGNTATTFNIVAVDDSLVDGTQTVILTASATNYSSDTETLSVIDDEDSPSDSSDTETLSVIDNEESSSSSSGMEPLPRTMGLFVKIDGTGSGSVKSQPIGIDCQPSHCTRVKNDLTGIKCDSNYCAKRFETATHVKLTVTADPGSFFSSWGGHPDCADSKLWMTGNKLCIAYFRKE